MVASPPEQEQQYKGTRGSETKPNILMQTLSDLVHTCSHTMSHARTHTHAQSFTPQLEHDGDHKCLQLFETKTDEILRNLVKSYRPDVFTGSHGFTN